MRLVTLILLSLLFLLSCSRKQKVSLLLYNATIYTVDSTFSIAEAMVVNDGKIAAIGKLSELENKYDVVEKLDVEGKFIYPGFIDAHAHFVKYATYLQSVDLVGTKNWDEVIDKVKTFSQNHSQGW